MNNQIVVVVGADGRILNTEQDGVFRRSNKQNELVALLGYPSIDSVKVNFLRADNVKPNSQYMSFVGEQEYDGVMYKAFSYYLLDYQLYATGQLVVSLDVISGSLTATTGDFTIDVESSEDACGAETPTDPNQFDEAIKSLMNADVRLAGRVSALENIVETDAPVVTIQKVAPNAFTYTNSKGITSAPIVLDGHGGAGLSSNQASTLLIPQSAWQLVDANNPSAGYKCGISAALHGQMRNGATYRDLWVSFGEVENDNVVGVVQSYTVDETGEIMIIVKNPIDLVVRVWNGKGISAIVKWGVNAPSKLSTIEWITVGGN